MINKLHITNIIADFVLGKLDRIERDRLLSHCENCESCKGQLYRQFCALALEKGLDKVSLKSDYFRGDCFSPKTLVAYAEGQLQPDEKRLVEEHLSHCRICQAELEVEALEASEWYPTQKFESSRTFPLRSGPVPSPPIPLAASEGLLSGAQKAPAKKPTRILGELMMDGIHYKLVAEGDRAFLTPYPDEKYTSFELDEQAYPLGPKDGAGDRREVKGMKIYTITKKLNDLKQNPETHQYKLR